MTRKCPSCSADVLDNAKFCIKCGAKMPALSPSPSVAAPFAPSSPTPSPIHVPSAPERVPVRDSVITPVKEVVPQIDRSRAQEESHASNASQSKKVESNISKSGGKGIIFAVIGVAIVGGGAFFFISNKQAPTQAPTPASAVTTPAPAASSTVAPAVVPAKPEALVAPTTPVTPKSAPKPAAPADSAPSTPDINKIMRDAANK